MKKKLVALLMAGAMLAGNTVYVMADETEAEAAVEVKEYYFEDIPEIYDGTWVPFEAGFQLYIPSDWSVPEISEEDAASVLFAAQAADLAQGQMVVTYSEVEESLVEADMIDQLSEAGYTDVEEVFINDIDAVTYTDEANDAAGMAFLDGAGIMYNVTVSPISDEEVSLVTGSILYSLSVADDTEEVETEAAE